MVRHRAPGASPTHATWAASKKCAAAEEVSIPHAVEHLRAAYATDLDAIVAQLEELAASPQG